MQRLKQVISLMSLIIYDKLSIEECIQSLGFIPTSKLSFHHFKLLLSKSSPLRISLSWSTAPLQLAPLGPPRPARLSGSAAHLRNSLLTAATQTLSLLFKRRLKTHHVLNHMLSVTSLSLYTGCAFHCFLVLSTDVFTVAEVVVSLSVVTGSLLFQTCTF